MTGKRYDRLFPPGWPPFPIDGGENGPVFRPVPVSRRGTVPSIGRCGKRSFFSLNNTDFVVSVSFLLFVALLVWLRVPGGLQVCWIDVRKESGKISTKPASFGGSKALLDASEKKRKEVDDQTETIIRRAQEEAETAAEQARKDLHAAVTRRIQAAEDRIASAEADAIREVQDAAANVAVAVAADVISSRMSDRDADELIEEAIENAAKRLELVSRQHDLLGPWTRRSTWILAYDVIRPAHRREFDSERS